MVHAVIKHEWKEYEYNASMVFSNIDSHAQAQPKSIVMSHLFQQYLAYHPRLEE